MLDPKTLDEMTRRLTDAIPPGLRQLQSDAEKNVRAALQTAFTRMDLVTREEFDVQQAVLARTRSRVEELERQLMLLEERLTALGTPAMATVGVPSDAPASHESDKPAS